jgi:hypothetical protein
MRRALLAADGDLLELAVLFIAWSDAEPASSALDHSIAELAALIPIASSEPSDALAFEAHLQALRELQVSQP